jgi:pimeloyl-ACP methyl ester carboxylesterase
MAFIEVNGERLHVVQTGEGPAVLCIHGLGAGSAMWRTLMDDLGGSYAVTAIDCRGHGESSCNGALTIENVADDLDAAATALGLDAFHLIGVSFGAQVAAQLAGRTPQRVRSLVLVGGALKAGDNLADELYGIREAVHYLNEEDFAQQTAEALLSADAPREPVGLLAADMMKLGQKRYLEGLASFAASDNTAQAGRITAPALILRGELDDLILPEETDALAAAIAGAGCETIPDAGHFACLDNAKSVNAFNRTVAEFLDGVSS